MEISNKKSWRNYVFPFFALLFALGSFVALQSVDEGLMPWFHDRYLEEDWFQSSMLWHYGAHGVLVGILFGGSLVSLLWKAEAKPLALQFYTVGHIIFIFVGIITYDQMLTMPFVLIMFTTVNLLLILTYIRPKQLLKIHKAETVNKPLLIITIAATLVLLPQIWHGLSQQWNQVGGEFRWGEMAVMYTVLLIAGYGAALGKEGAKVLSTLAAIAYLYLAILSFSVPDFPGSWGYVGGVLSLLMSGSFVYFGLIKKVENSIENKVSVS
ncbi:hypothetical protein [Niallia endozanthoxylica]|uniref:Uncharacterized protein n=1 Tax=Niallia endozanthoxylica TaxID=2036016 RepID=A0A5J5I2V0_9BACI|nr:hypothetical protein [Niallia endozanthoxylica]KAA9029113.1 hypothetical protein F4V44_03350 [Niallia endozanthoxylica]